MYKLSTGAGVSSSDPLDGIHMLATSSTRHLTSPRLRRALHPLYAVRLHHSIVIDAYSLVEGVDT